jgi:GT2 family glycosyltransferase
MSLNQDNYIPAVTPAGDNPVIPELTVCIVTYNRSDDVDNALLSIYEHAASLGPEVIVVDNNSTDGTRELIADKYPKACVIHNPINQGYGPAMNLALAQARGEFVLTLSSDAVLKPGAAQTLVKFMRTHPRAGLAGPRTLDARGKIVTTLHHPSIMVAMWSQIIPIAKFIRERPWLRRQLTKLFPNSSGQTSNYDYTRRVPMVDGGCVLARRSAIVKVGLLDPLIPLGPDDYDWCFRMRQAEFEVWYVAESEIIHRTSVKDNIIDLSPGYLSVKFPVFCYFYGKYHRGAKRKFFYLSAYLGNWRLYRQAMKVYGSNSPQVTALAQAAKVILHPETYAREVGTLFARN